MQGRGSLFAMITLFPTHHTLFDGVTWWLWKFVPAPAEQHGTHARHRAFLNCPLDMQACHPLTSRQWKVRVYLKMGLGIVFTLPTSEKKKKETILILAILNSRPETVKPGDSQNVLSCGSKKCETRASRRSGLRTPRTSMANGHRLRVVWTTV